MADYVNTPFAAFVNYIDSERQKQRQIDDADLDKKIALIHDLISGPGANPARTAEGIRGIMELQGAKGGRGKRKSGLNGFMGAQEEVMPDFLANLIHGAAPYEGPTYTESKQTVQEPGFERNALSPLAPGGFGQIIPKTQFDGKSVLQEPVMVPPPPLESAPTGSPMLSAARQMQHEETIKTPLPAEQQPFHLTPDEMAQQEGHAAGVKAGSIADANKASVIKQMRELGASDEEIKAALLQQIGGRTSQMQDADAGFYTVNGQTRRAVRVFSPYTGAVQTLDALTRLPIPPEAVPAPAPGLAKPETLTLQDFMDTWTKEHGRPPNYAELAKIQNDWQQNGKTNINVNLAGQGGMSNHQSTVFNQIVNHYQTSPLMKAKDRLVTLQDNIKQVVANPRSGAGQLALGYSFVQALDTYQSAVREGELRNLSTIDSAFGRLRLAGERMMNGEIMRPEIAIQIAQAAKSLNDAIVKGAAAKEVQFRSQAAVNGLGSQWDQYVGGFNGGAAIPVPPGAPAGAPAQLSPQAQAILEGLKR